MIVKKYMDLHDMKRDFTLLTKVLKKLFRSFEAQAKLFSDVDWKNKFRLMNKIKVKNDNKLLQQVADNFQRIADLNFQVEILCSMYQQLGTDFNYKKDEVSNIRIRRLENNLKKLISLSHEKLNEQLRLMSNLTNSKPRQELLDIVKRLPHSNCEFYSFTLLDQNKPVSYDIVRLKAVVDFDEFCLYIRTGDTKQVYYSDYFVSPTFEDPSLRVDTTNIKESIDFICKNLGLLEPTQSIPYINSSLSSVKGSSLWLLLTIQKDKMSKLKANKVVVRLKFELNKLGIKATYRLLSNAVGIWCIITFEPAILPNESVVYLGKLLGMQKQVLDLSQRLEDLS